MIPCGCILLHHPRTLDTVRHSMLTDVLADLAICAWSLKCYFKNIYAVPIWGPTLVRWCNLYFLLTHDLLDICIFSFIEIMTMISDFLRNLNPTISSLSSQAFTFILLQEFWNYMQFNLSLTL